MSSCTQCGASFRTPLERRKHRMQVHSAAAPSPPPLPDDLTYDQCLELVSSLVLAYSQPAFVQQLHSLSSGNFLAQLGPMVLKVQAPLFRKFGLEIGPAGVERMKNGVHRRIAEASPRRQRQLHDLTNKARAQLGIAPTSDLALTGQQTAEGALVRMLGENPLDTPFGLTSCSVPSSQALQLEATVAVESGQMTVAAGKYLQAQLARGVPPLIVRTELQMARCGIPHQSLTGEDIELDASFLQVPILTSMPSSDDFWNHHVLPNRPAVLRGLIDAQNCPPLANFTDFDYLRRRCGHRRVPVKSLAVHDALGRPMFVSDPELRVPLVAFLDAVEAVEASSTAAEADGAEKRTCPFYLGKVPLQEELPELAEDIRAHPPGPVEALRGCFGDQIPQGVYTYFGCDRNLTPTHFDPQENLLCCLCGTKRLWLYPPSDTDSVYPVPGKNGSRAAAPPFQSYYDLAPELRDSFAKVANARPVEVNLRAGDVLYLPVCWWHCVEGSRERNMIVNYWMEMHPKKHAMNQ